MLSGWNLTIYTAVVDFRSRKSCQSVFSSHFSIRERLRTAPGLSKRHHFFVTRTVYDPSEAYSQPLWQISSGKGFARKAEATKQAGQERYETFLLCPLRDAWVQNPEHRVDKFGALTAIPCNRISRRTNGSPDG